MIIISDLNDSYIEKVTKPEASNIIGGVSPLTPSISINVNIDFVNIIQINAFTNNVNNYANVNI